MAESPPFPETSIASGRELPSAAASGAPQSVVVAYHRLAAEPFVTPGRIRLTRIDAAELTGRLRSNLQSGAAFVLQLFGNESVAIADVVFQSCGHRSAVPWTASASRVGRRGVSTRERGSVVLSIAEDSVYGAIDFIGQSVRIRPLGQGFCAIYEVAFAGLPPHDHPAYARRPSRFRPRGRERTPGGHDPQVAVIRDECARIRIRVAFAFTAESAAELEALNTDLGAWAQSRLDGANTSFRDSGIHVVLELAGTLPTAISEFSVAPATLARRAVGLMLMDTTDARMDPLLDWWSGTGAPSLILIGELGAHSNADFYGGSTHAAWTPLFEDRLSTVFDDPGDAPGYRGYSVVNRAAAENSHSLTHEFGHQLGLQHEAGKAYGGVIKVIRRKPLRIDDYARGYTPPQSGGHSIMAIADGNPATRIGLFSRASPYAATLSPSNATLVLGNAHANNVRLANELAPIFAQRVPPGR